MMELIPMDICVLCDQNTAVLSSDNLTPYVKYMDSTFFDKDRLAFERFQEVTVDRRFCALCAQKIVVSHKLKDNYEEISRKRISIKKTRTACLLCESKSSDLIETTDNPNEFDTKIKSFMDSTLYPRPYLQCAVCLDCLFYLSVWFEMNRYIVEKINDKKSSKTQAASESPKVIPSTRSKRTSNLKTDDVGLKNGKENITPENSNNTMLRQIHPESESAIETPSRKEKQKTTSIISKSPHKGNKISESEEEASKKFHIFLKRTLKHLKSIEANMYTTEWTRNVIEDKKMFACIPYVLIAKNKNETTPKPTNSFRKPQKRRFNLSLTLPIRRSTRSDKPIEIIELSDTDSVATTEDVTVTPRTRKRTMKLIKACKSPIKYNCNICDQEFEANCDYKAHCLWHEKPENIVINVARENLDDSIKSYQCNSKHSSPQKSKQKSEQDNSNIDHILQKYISLPTTDTLDLDSDSSNSNQITKIIDTLNSEEKETLENCDLSDKTTDCTSKIEKDIINSNPDTKIDADAKEASNTDKSRPCQIESEAAELEISSKESENIETVTDNESNTENDSKIVEKTATVDDVVDIPAENKEIEDVLPEEEELRISPLINEQTENINDQELNKSPSINEQTKNIKDQDPNKSDQNIIESDLENTASDSEENMIENRLAEIHGEEQTLLQNHSDEEQETEKHDEEETHDSLQSANEIIDDNDLPNGKAAINNEIFNMDGSSNETDMENKEEENRSNKISIINENHFSKKRKRALSVMINDYKYEDCLSDTEEIVSPKAKKVRFAMDYQCRSPPPENKDNVSDEVIEPEKDKDINSSTEVQELDD